MLVACILLNKTTAKQLLNNQGAAACHRSLAGQGAEKCEGQKAGAKTARATGAWIAAAHDMEPLLRAALPIRTGTASPARHMQQGAT
jgi:hypothetical protein